MSEILLLVLRVFLVICLYAFILWVLVQLWRDLKSQTVSLTPARVPELVLYPQSIDEADPLKFSGGEIMVGRDPTVDCVIDDRTISSRHARLIYRQEQWWVEDMGSTNGTYLNDALLDTPTVITTGDRLQFGQNEYLVAIELLDHVLVG